MSRQLGAAVGFIFILRLSLGLYQREEPLGGCLGQGPWTSHHIGSCVVPYICVPQGCAWAVSRSPNLAGIQVFEKKKALGIK